MQSWPGPSVALFLSLGHYTHTCPEQRPLTLIHVQRASGTIHVYKYSIENTNNKEGKTTKTNTQIQKAFGGLSAGIRRFSKLLKSEHLPSLIHVLIHTSYVCLH